MVRPARRTSRGIEQPLYFGWVSEERDLRGLGMDGDQGAEARSHLLAVAEAVSPVSSQMGKVKGVVPVDDPPGARRQVALQARNPS